LFFLALSAWAIRPLPADINGQTLSGPDPTIDLWTVNWLSAHLLRPSELWGGNIFHPAPHAVLYSDLSLGTAVWLVPLRPFVHDPVPLYNLGLILALTMTGWSFHALVRELTGSRSAGLLTGILASFGSHQMSHIYHLNLLTTGWLALFLLGLGRLASRPSWGAGLLTGLSFALTAQSSGYYAVSALILGLTFLATHPRVLSSRKALLGLGAAAAVGLLLTLPYLSAYLEIRSRDGLRRPLGMSRQMAFKPARDLTSHGYLYGPVLGSSGEQLFPGLLSLGLAGTALLRRRPESSFYFAAFFVLLLLSLGPFVEIGSCTIPLPYRLLFFLPPLDSMRHPYTFAAVATLALSVLAGIGWASLEGASRWSPLVLALGIAETLGPPPHVRAIPQGVPPAYALLDTLPPGPVLEVPVFADDALVWAARHGRPVLNGIGAFAPTDSMVLERLIENHWLKRVPQDLDSTKAMQFLLDRFPLRYVILPAGRRPELRKLEAPFDRSSNLVLIAVATDGDRLYGVKEESTDAGQEGEKP